MDGILEHATNIIQAAKQPKNKTREKKQQKCWCHYLFTRGLWGLGRGGEGSLVMANARSAWSFSLDSFSCPGTKRFVTVGTRLYAAHLSRHGDANTNHLSFSLFFSLEQSQVQSLCRLVFLHGCCKFSKTSYSAMPQAFSQITSNISPLKSDILPSNLYRVLIYCTFISGLSHSALVLLPRISRPLNCCP